MPEIISSRLFDVLKFSFKIFKSSLRLIAKDIKNSDDPSSKQIYGAVTIPRQTNAMYSIEKAIK